MKTMLLMLPLLSPLLSSEEGYVKEACVQAKCFTNNALKAKFLSNALNAKFFKALTANSSDCSSSLKFLSSSDKVLSCSN